MAAKYLKHLANPVAMRIFAEARRREQVTANELREEMPDVAQATLYRRLKAMVDDGLLLIAEERQIRNLTEKAYTANLDVEKELFAGVTNNDGTAYLTLFEQYQAELLHEFRNYVANPVKDIQGDGSGFTVRPFYASVDELVEMATKIAAVIEPYMEHKATPERSLRSIAIIYTPPHLD